MKKYITETQRIILKVYVINLLIYLIKFPVNFKYRSIHRWCSLNSYKVRNIHRKTSVLESLFNKFIGLQVCNFTKKRLQHKLFPVNIVNFKNTYFEKHLRTADSDSSYILHTKLNKIIQEADWPPDWPFQIGLLFLLKHKITLLYLLSFVFIRFITRYPSLLFIVIFCYSLSFVVSCCTTRCHSLNHSLPFVVPLDVTRCHSLSFDVTRCTTLFTNDHYFIIFCFLNHL